MNADSSICFAQSVGGSLEDSIWARQEYGGIPNTKGEADIGIASARTEIYYTGIHCELEMKHHGIRT